MQPQCLHIDTCLCCCFWQISLPHCDERKKIAQQMISFSVSDFSFSSFLHKLNNCHKKTSGAICGNFISELYCWMQNEYFFSWSIKFMFFLHLVLIWQMSLRKQNSPNENSGLHSGMKHIQRAASGRRQKFPKLVLIILNLDIYHKVQTGKYWTLSAGVTKLGEPQGQSFDFYSLI